MAYTLSTRIHHDAYPSLDLTGSITFLRNHDLCPTSVAGDGAREGMVNDVAGVNMVACVDVIIDAECDIEEGVEERDGVENPDCADIPL
jgi:hypothetical protein